VSAKVQGWVWDLDDMLPQRRLILLWLANRATDNGVCFPGQAEVRKRTSLGEKMVRRHLHWLAAAEDDDGRSKQPLVTIIERRIGSDRNTSNVYVLHVPWARRTDVQRDLEELKHLPASAALSLNGVGVVHDPQDNGKGEHRSQGGGHERPPSGSPAGGMGVTGGREEPGHRKRHPEQPLSPHPPALSVPRSPQQQGGDCRESETSREPALDDQIEPSASSLVDAFYRGLGAAPTATTASLRRRDLAIARQLVAIGATAEEAEAYAREASAVSSRIAPVDLRSFERERLGWLARRRGKDLSERRVVDRTGQPPSWETQPSASSLPPGGQVPAQRPERGTIADVSGIPGLSGNQLAGRLRTLFTGGRP
jgi:hypothetical protein